MNTRRDIMRLCKKLGLTVVSLTFERNYEYVYGDGFDISTWSLVVSNGIEQEEWNCFRDEFFGGLVYEEIREFAGMKGGDK